MKLVNCLALILILGFNKQDSPDNYKTDRGKVRFNSEAQLEIINASSTRLRGVLNPVKRTFAFAVPVSSFEGFNAALQRDHFNENYLESDRFPVATFTGKIIEELSYPPNGALEVRAKGMLTIHGVEQERIIKVSITMIDGIMHVFSRFNVSLKDHDIKVPKVVHEKIASEISIEVQAELKKGI